MNLTTVFGYGCAMAVEANAAATETAAAEARNSAALYARRAKLMRCPPGMSVLLLCTECSKSAAHVALAAANVVSHPAIESSRPRARHTGSIPCLLIATRAPAEPIYPSTFAAATRSTAVLATPPENVVVI